MASKYELALKEIKNNYKLQCEGIDICKRSAQSSINSSGLIIALISLLERKNGYFFSLDINNILFWSWIITITIFIAMVIIYVLAIRPIVIVAPVKSTKNRFNEVFFNQSDRKSIVILINEYMETINENRQILIKASNLAKWTNYLAALSIVSAFAVFIIGSIFVKEVI